MPTDAELRSLFHDAAFHNAAAPVASLDAAAIIRRSKRRRLPQQVGAGSVLTLAVAGIGVASLNGLQGLAPMGASQTMADAPASESSEESGQGADGAVPWMDSGTSLRQTSCDVPVADGRVDEALEITPVFSTVAPTGEAVVGTLNLTNTGSLRIVGVAANPTVTLVRHGERILYSDRGATETRVDLAPGESISLSFSFDAFQCDAEGGATGAALEAGAYTLSAEVELRPDAGPSRLVSGPVSAITLR
ncbi:hypothetical protein ACX3O0_08280 [Homoserinimonas sp. A447]